MNERVELVQQSASGYELSFSYTEVGSSGTFLAHNRSSAGLDLAGGILERRARLCPSRRRQLESLASTERQISTVMSLDPRRRRSRCVEFKMWHAMFAPGYRYFNKYRGAPGTPSRSTPDLQGKGYTRRFFKWIKLGWGNMGELSRVP